MTETDRQTNKQTDRQTDRLRHRERGKEGWNTPVVLSYPFAVFLWRERKAERQTEPDHRDVDKHRETTTSRGRKREIR